MLAEEIESILRKKFAPTQLELVDEAHLHLGHGAKGGHFRLVIASAHFVGKKPLERQRMVYEALGNLMREKVHALSMRCLD